MVYSQTASNVSPDIFDKITRAVQDFKVDTTMPPHDHITKKIIELRKLRGGFNIQEAITYKIKEDSQKKNITEEQARVMTDFFSSGNGKRWLDNAMVWIYRQHFNYKEIKQLVKFYKTTAGRKMATDFPIIMAQSIKAAEVVKAYYH